MSRDISDDPILGPLFDSAEKKARWLVRIKIAYYIWIAFMVIGILFFLLWFIFK